jgi:hypothetical protein
MQRPHRLLSQPAEWPNGRMAECGAALPVDSPEAIAFLGADDAKSGRPRRGAVLLLLLLLPVGPYHRVTASASAALDPTAAWHTRAWRPNPNPNPVAALANTLP